MSDKTLEQMLEHLVNDDQEKAEELFHEYVVAKSREIYEGLIEAEEGEFDDTDKDEDNDDEEDVKEADMMDLPDEETGDLEDEITIDDEGDDEEGDDEEESEELFQDLESIVDELQAKFDELKGEESDEDEMDSEMDMEPEMDSDEEDDSEMENFASDEDTAFESELAQVREYVERMDGKGASSSESNADNTDSVVDDMKNDMGGTTDNILAGGEGETGGSAETPKDMNTGNVNKVGGTKSGKMMNKAPSGADAKETGADNTDSVLRSKR